MYKFIRMQKPLIHPVYNGSKCVIPAGTEHVQIAFRQSHLVRNIVTGAVYPVDFGSKPSKNEVRCNVYRLRGNRNLIHA